jgi:hypothetical protein
VQSVYQNLLVLLDDVIESLFEDTDEIKRYNTEGKINGSPVKKRSTFKNFASKIKKGLKKKKSQDFFIKTRFSSDILHSTGEEIMNSLKSQLVQFHQIHDTCLFLLRGEIRMRIYSFLSNIKNQNYWDGEEHADAEWFIGHLSRELLLFQLAVKSFLSIPKLSFIWESALDIIVEMLITGLREIKDLSMSKQGLATYIKNVKVLQAEIVQIEIVTST